MGSEQVGLMPSALRSVPELACVQDSPLPPPACLPFGRNGIRWTLVPWRLRLIDRWVCGLTARMRLVTFTLEPGPGSGEHVTAHAA
jgi:hypothetical protein